MRQKKIRGHKRRHKQIENWRLNNLSLNLTHYLRNMYERYYAKIKVPTWNRLLFTNSTIQQPTGKTKQKMLNGLLDIYENWKTQLDKLEQPYYLKIWLFEPRFLQSQVVCAIGESINFYENIFYKPDTNKVIQLTQYGALKTKLSKLHWDYRLDEDHYEDTEVGKPESYASKQDYEDAVKDFDKLLKKPHRIHKIEDSIGKTIVLYSLKRGDVWLGG